MKDIELFEGKNLSGLFEDIYKTSIEKKKQINALIGELKPLIKNTADATILIPLIAEYMEVSVKNDDQLVKMAAIAQRLASKVNGNSKEIQIAEILTDEEKKELLSNYNNKYSLDYDYNIDKNKRLK